MKRVSFVIGPANSGKTFFIKHHFANAKIIDLYDFQEGVTLYSVEDIMEAYLECAYALKTALESYDDVVLEHTLMKAPRRPMYIDAVREVCGAGQPIDCYYSMPDIDDYLKYDQLNIDETQEKYPDKRFFPISRKRAQEMLDFFDIPQANEGFEKIYCIQNLA